ncbi:MAG TPA: UbiH/UbiF family hydroxylase [Nitrosomonas sp.]|nr:UbiH/UbiF family hydroxylase [Nitrosomonas sp.]HMW20347.1 UbiH/UbiF family hydroxylase [Nitrosomonas sp.]HMW69513.1 UbiH/UbiF family hydroxylase [Nitrosomonas sp.]HMY61678.1 UbiH/UbiF family hydroxylase [Nitrosomonas sp.]HND36028.1 UbiH/UbiF family hydroxylase [Nitrosomonas sp.]
MKFDIVIIGGGLVGASLATSLKGSHLTVALIDAAAPTPLPNDASWDNRIYTISPGSADFLRSLGLWQQIDASRVTPIYEMNVFGDDGAAEIDFGAYESGLPELAFVTENRQLQAVLWGALLNDSQNITVFSSAKCTAISWHDSGVNILLADGRTIQASLIVGADGVNSWVREQAGITVEHHRYEQIGVVANFSTELAHHNIAYQWFRRDGVLAFLPLPDKRVSIVWSTHETHANELRNISDEEFSQRVSEASNRVLGRLQLITQPAGFPLNFVHVSKLVKPRLVLIGDAAHGIHPLAGQGVNLGLRDVKALSEILKKDEIYYDYGDYILLLRYERARKADITAMETVTDGLHKLFNSQDPIIRRFRNLGLTMTNRLPFIKSKLMQHALN